MPSTPKTDNALGFHLLRTIPLHIEVKSVSLSPDARHIALHFADETLTIWSTATGRRLFTIPKSESKITLYRWVQPHGGPFGFGLVCAYSDGKLQLIEHRETEEPIALFPGPLVQAHDREITAIAVDKAHTLIGTVCCGLLKLWNINNNWTLQYVDQASIPLPQKGALPHLRCAFFFAGSIFVPSGQLLINWKITDWTLKEEAPRILSHKAYSAEVSVDEKTLLVYNVAEGTFQYSLPNFHCREKIRSADKTYQTFAFARRDQALVFGDQLGTIQLRHLPSLGLTASGSLSHHKRGGVASAVSARSIGMDSFIVSATTQESRKESATAHIWTDSVGFASSLRPYDVDDVKASISLRRIFVFGQFFLLGIMAKFCYDLGRLAGCESDLTFEHYLDLHMLVWNISTLSTDYMKYLESLTLLLWVTYIAPALKHMSRYQERFW